VNERSEIDRLIQAGGPVDASELLRPRRFAGTIELSIVDAGQGIGEIGFLLLPEMWGQGLAAEAARLLCDHAFSDLGLQRVQATCSPENVRSVRVLEKIGMKREGILRGYRVQRGVRVDKLLFVKRVEQ
jgi:RimJ/RimL family protein N-acetyltransferase